MMHRQKFLLEAMGEPRGMSRSAMALCSAVIEDAEDAREFEFESRNAVTQLYSIMPGAGSFTHRESSLSPRELTSLIA